MIIGKFSTLGNKVLLDGIIAFLIYHFCVLHNYYGEEIILGIAVIIIFCSSVVEVSDTCPPVIVF